MNFIDDTRLFFEQIKNDTLKVHKKALEGIIDEIIKEVLRNIENADSLEKVKNVQVDIFGKKGCMTELLKNMRKVSVNDRPLLGKLLHKSKQIIKKKLEDKIIFFAEQEEEFKLHEEIVDITLPGQKVYEGHKHPITLIQEEIISIFNKIGYTVVEGYEIEEDYYNFERLNIPKDHPAREMQDSFYINQELVLRTHTSPIQVRTMDKITPQLPVKIISPGKVFRRDDDSTHSSMFHQIEGLLIGKNITFANLKGTLFYFLRKIFGEDREIRLRPSYFPFTEPSGEVDVSCGNCGGVGCRVCSYSGWLEILGSGMVHPKVLKMAGYNIDEVQGFAFGLGVERVAMLKYDINNIRLFYENDNRFLKQF